MYPYMPRYVATNNTLVMGFRSWASFEARGATAVVTKVTESQETYFKQNTYRGSFYRMLSVSMASYYALPTAAVLDANLEIYPSINSNIPTKLTTQFGCEQPLISVDLQLELVTAQVLNRQKCYFTVR